MHYLTCSRVKIEFDSSAFNKSGLKLLLLLYPVIEATVEVV